MQTKSITSSRYGPQKACAARPRWLSPAHPFPVQGLNFPGEQIPLENDSVDTVLLTCTLCTIPDWCQAMSQMWRGLKPDGKLVFCEHGEAPAAAVRRWQNRLNPIWSCFAGGCQ
jgi:SAM-dependent methyltransferase